MQQSPFEQITTSSYPSFPLRSGAPPAGGGGSAPRPTLADIDLPPRRRLRDGSRSNAGSSPSGSGSGSRASSVSSTHSGRGTNSRGKGRGRGRSVSTFSTVSSNGLSSGPSVLNMPLGSGRGRRGTGVGVRRSPRTRQTSISNHHSQTSPDPTLSHSTTNGITGSNRVLSPVASGQPEIDMNAEAEAETGLEHSSSLIEMLDAIDPTRNTESFGPQPTTTNPDADADANPDDAPSGSSSSSTSTPRTHETQAERDRRFTAAEKGKGRAIAPEAITISEDEDGEIEVTGMKRKIYTLDDEDEDGDGDIDGLEGGMGGIVNKQTKTTGDVADVVPIEEEEEMTDVLGEFTCPVCFCEPTQAVMTICGHTLCAECLHQSLLAAIARNPNPYPQNQPPRPRPKPKKRGKKNSIIKEHQPTEWTPDGLRETWSAAREREYEGIARAAGMDPASIEAGRNDQPVEVVMVLKGLWKVDSRYWVIEGECPVCRKGIPGGYGPPGKGVGGVISLEMRVGKRT